MGEEGPDPEQYPTPRAAVPGVPAYAVVQGQALDAREDLIKCTNCLLPHQGPDGVLQLRNTGCRAGQAPESAPEAQPPQT